jgi:hypothetical protein
MNYGYPMYQGGGPVSGMAGGLASLGRQGDSELVHMSPEEIDILSQMGELTINPYTGLPEAFSLKNFFKKLGKVGLGVGIAGLGMVNPVAGALASGAISGIKNKSIKEGMFSGLKSYMLGRALSGLKGGFDKASMPSIGTGTGEALVKGDIGVRMTGGELPSALDKLKGGVSGLAGEANPFESKSMMMAAMQLPNLESQVRAERMSRDYDDGIRRQNEEYEQALADAWRKYRARFGDNPYGSMYAYSRGMSAGGSVTREGYRKDERKTDTGGEDEQDSPPGAKPKVPGIDYGTLQVATRTPMPSAPNWYTPGFMQEYQYFSNGSPTPTPTFGDYAQKQVGTNPFFPKQQSDAEKAFAASIASRYGGGGINDLAGLIGGSRNPSSDDAAWKDQFAAAQARAAEEAAANNAINRTNTLVNPYYPNIQAPVAGERKDGENNPTPSGLPNPVVPPGMSWDEIMDPNNPIWNLGTGAKGEPIPGAVPQLPPGSQTIGLDIYGRPIPQGSTNAWESLTEQERVARAMAGQAFLGTSSFLNAHGGLGGESTTRQMLSDWSNQNAIDITGFDSYKYLKEYMEERGVDTSKPIPQDVLAEHVSNFTTIGLDTRDLFPSRDARTDTIAEVLRALDPYFTHHAVSNNGMWSNSNPLHAEILRKSGLMEKALEAARLEYEKQVGGHAGGGVVGAARGFADGGAVGGGLDEEAIQALIQAIPAMGQPWADQIIQQFISTYGPEAFQAVREMVMQQAAPGAQTEGMVDGADSGMADTIPGYAYGGQTGGQQIAVSPGEFIVPADVVSMLGDGNTKNGAAQLYDMMERVRTTKTGSPKQAPPINPRGVLPV